jgi:hypothetical protein
VLLSCTQLGDLREPEQTANFLFPFSRLPYMPSLVGGG